MAAKFGINQHEILHQHFPGDCCLCKAEHRILELEKIVKTLVDRLNKLEDKPSSEGYHTIELSEADAKKYGFNSVQV